jgi:hypothetical protein
MCIQQRLITTTTTIVIPAFSPIDDLLALGSPLSLSCCPSEL